MQLKKPAMGLLLVAVLLAGAACSGAPQSRSGSASASAEKSSAASSAGEEEKNERNHYRIALNLDNEQHRVSEAMELAVQNDSEDSWNQIVLRDYMASALQDSGLKSGISSASAEGTPLDFATDAEDASVVRIVLKKPLAPGDTIVLQLAYETDIPDNGDRCLYGSLSAEMEQQSTDGKQTIELAQCFPILAVYENGDWVCEPYFDAGECMYSRCADYDVSISLPQGWVVAATGVETPEQSGEAVNWSVKAQNVRDFTLVASNELETLTDTVDGVEITSYFGAESEKNRLQGEASLETAKRALKIFNEAYGTYPYSEFDVLQSLNMVGGIESPELIRISRFFAENLGPEGGDVDARLLGNTVAHEVAHEWFYAVVGNNQYRDAWLDEGFASFSALLFAQRDGWGEEYVENELALGRSFYQEIQSDGFVDKPYDVLDGNYSVTVYQHAEDFLYRLCQAMGEEDFLKFVQKYYADYKFREADTEAFLAEIAPFIEGNSAATAIVQENVSAAN